MAHHWMVDNGNYHCWILFFLFPRFVAICRPPQCADAANTAFFLHPNFFLLPNFAFHWHLYDGQTHKGTSFQRFYLASLSLFFIEKVVFTLDKKSAFVSVYCYNVLAAMSGTFLFSFLYIELVRKSNLFTIDNHLFPLLYFYVGIFKISLLREKKCEAVSLLGHAQCLCINWTQSSWNVIALTLILKQSKEPCQKIIKWKNTGNSALSRKAFHWGL